MQVGTKLCISCFQEKKYAYIKVGDRILCLECTGAIMDVALRLHLE